MFRLKHFGTISLIAALTFACGKSDSDDNEDTTNTSTSPGGGGTGATGANSESTVAVTGTIALNLGLTTSVTHVIANDAEDNETVVAEVAADGSFTLDIETDKNWVVSYINGSESGEDMLVSTFASGELDTIVTNTNSSDISLGEIDVSEEEATSETDDTTLLAAMNVSEAAAETFGAIDDVALRYSNPDINGDGDIDAVEGHSFPLDFHNRFRFKNSEDDSNYAFADIKNAFVPFDSTIEFTGSGVIPWFDSKHFGGTFSDYTWTFSNDVELGTNGGQVCSGMSAGDTLTANTACELELDGNQSVEDHPGVELLAAVDGTYILEANSKTFTWTKVKVSDFSAGEGFIALFVRMDVDDDEMLTGISYSWRKKDIDGSYELASAEELKLVINKRGGSVSLKVDGADSGKEIGVAIPLEPAGSVVFADATYTGDEPQIFLGDSEVTESTLKSSGIDWSRVMENAGISYDDKLGMRFFFGYEG